MAARNTKRSPRSRWSYGKIEDCEQSTIYPRPSTIYPQLSTIYPRPSTKTYTRKALIFLNWPTKKESWKSNGFLKGHILVPRARRFLIMWSWNERLWRQTLPDVRKFRTSGLAWAEVTNITAHSHNRFLSPTAPLGTKRPELSPECGFFGLFWKYRLHSTRIHCQFRVKRRRY